MPKYTQEQVDEVHKLNLNKDDKWVDLSFVAPGLVIESHKRVTGDDGKLKWAAIDLDCSELATVVVDVHNSWLADQETI